MAVVVRDDRLDAARDDDLGAQPLRLLGRPRCQVVARDAAREAEVVLDARRRAGLAAGRLALDEQRAQPFGCSVHGRRKARRAAAHDHEVVGVAPGLDLQADPFGQLGDRGAREDASVGQQYHRAIRSRGDRSLQARPGRDPVVVRIRPLEAHLIAREEVAQVVARRIMRAADHDGQVQLLGRLVLQALDAELDARDQPLLERVRGAHEQAELRAIEARDADRRDRAGAGEEGRAEHDRQVAEPIARLAAGDPALAVGIALDEVPRPRTGARRTPPTRPRARATARRRCAHRRPARPRG